MAEHLARLTSVLLFCALRAGELAAQDAVRTTLVPDSLLCAPARAFLAQQADSMMNIRPEDWRPDSQDSVMVSAVKDADVVIQFRVDTLGRPDIDGARVLRSKSASLTGAAWRALRQLEAAPFEILPGCRAAYLRTLPFRWWRQDPPGS